MRHTVIDTETTGLIENSGRSLVRQPRVWEVCAFIYDDKGKMTGSFDEMFSLPPGEGLSAKVTSITNVRDEDLLGKPLFEKRAPAVRDFLAKGDVVIAHNLSFDMDMIDNEMKRCGLPPVEWPKRRICTVEQTRHLKGFNLNLGALHEHLFGVKHENAHRAEADVKALARCYFELKRRGEL
jgi:DNA polymerase III epsilon subunit-like protein